MGITAKKKKKNKKEKKETYSFNCTCNGVFISFLKQHKSASF